MERHSPLHPWLKRQDSLTSFFDLDTLQPNGTLGGYLALDLVYELHETLDIPEASFSDSWKKTHTYVREALQLIDAEQCVWLDNEEVMIITEELGSPPLCTYPIYLFSIGDDDSERPVYIGRTSSKTSRFANGHKVCSQLHDPKYDCYSKRLYLGAFTLLTSDRRYLPLEWVYPLENANMLLNSIEAQLIYYFQPELNINLRTNDNTTHRISPIHIQNFTNQTKFLNDYMCR